MSSASPGMRRRKLSCVGRRAFSIASGVTSTWMTIVLFGLVGSGTIAHRRMNIAVSGAVGPVPTQAPLASR